MRIKRDLMFLFQRCYWHLKSLKLLFWVPVVVVNLILPVLTYIRYRLDGIGDYMQVDITEKNLLFLPFLSVWWVIFILREYVEADGSEVLYVCNHKVKLADALCPFLLYLLNISLLYGIYTVMFPTIMPMEYGRMVSICCFFFGLTYFLIYLTKSITITIMLNLVYFIACTLFPLQQPVFPLFNVQQELGPALFLTLYFPLFAAGVVLTAAGAIINKRTACKN